MSDLAVADGQADDFGPEFVITGYRDVEGRYVIVGSNTVRQATIGPEDPDLGCCIDPRWKSVPEAVLVRARCEEVVMAWSTAGYEQAMRSMARVWKGET